MKLHERPPYLPTDTDLALAPELAVLAVLDAALRAARDMLAAAHGDEGLRMPLSPDQHTARHIHAAAKRLRSLIDTYRRRAVDDQL